VSEELEHVRRPHGHRIRADHGEEHLQVERHRPHRVWSAPAGDELEVTVDERISSA